MAQWCKKCKLVFEKPTCPGGHALFMYTKKIPAGATATDKGAAAASSATVSAAAAAAVGLARHLLALAAASRLLPHATASDAEQRAEAALAAQLGRALGAVPGLAAAAADPGLADVDAVERCLPLFGLFAASLRAQHAPPGRAAREPEGGSAVIVGDAAAGLHCAARAETSMLRKTSSKDLKDAASERALLRQRALSGSELSSGSPSERTAPAPPPHPMARGCVRPFYFLK